MQIMNWKKYGSGSSSWCPLGHKVQFSVKIFIYGKIHILVGSISQHAKEQIAFKKLEIHFYNYIQNHILIHSFYIHSTSEKF
jgi:hypothetical protein